VRALSHLPARALQTAQTAGRRPWASGARLTPAAGQVQADRVSGVCAPKGDRGTKATRACASLRDVLPAQATWGSFNDESESVLHRFAGRMRPAEVTLNCPGFDGDSYPVSIRSSWQHRIVPSSAGTPPRCASVRYAWFTRQSPRVTSVSVQLPESLAKLGFDLNHCAIGSSRPRSIAGKRPGITSAEQKRIAEA
jgi:hypothetical protein